jgi:hypothetical protein
MASQGLGVGLNVGFIEGLFEGLIEGYGKRFDLILQDSLTE